MTTISTDDLIEQHRAEIFFAAVAYLQERGHEASFRAEYSGRFMYGDKCAAIVTDAPAALVGWACCCASYDLEGCSAFDATVPTKEDSMGLSRIYY